MISGFTTPRNFDGIADPSPEKSLSHACGGVAEMTWYKPFVIMVSGEPVSLIALTFTLRYPMCKTTFITWWAVGGPAKDVISSTSPKPSSILILAASKE